MPQSFWLAQKANDLQDYYDNEYTIELIDQTDINYLSLYHYLVPSDIIVAPRETIGLEGFDINLVQGAICDGYAVAFSLQKCSEDSNQGMERRIDAYVLCAWMGTHDLDVRYLPSENPWTASFMLQCLREYPPKVTDSDMARERSQ